MRGSQIRTAQEGDNRNWVLLWSNMTANVRLSTGLQLVIFWRYSDLGEGKYVNSHGNILKKKI